MQYALKINLWNEVKKSSCLLKIWAGVPLPERIMCTNLFPPDCFFPMTHVQISLSHISCSAIGKKKKKKSFESWTELN